MTASWRIAISFNDEPIEVKASLLSQLWNARGSGAFSPWRNLMKKLVLTALVAAFAVTGFADTAKKCDKAGCKDKACTEKADTKDCKDKKNCKDAKDCKEKKAEPAKA